VVALRGHITTENLKLRAYLKGRLNKMISAELSEILKEYFTGKANLAPFLESLHKQHLEKALAELLNLYAQDKNSSTLREYITVTLSGYEHSGRKLGFNATRGGENVEVKPKNLQIEDCITKNKRHNGGGNFTDFTYARLEKYKSSNLTMLVSGFVSGNLMYILAFPFNCPCFIQRLKEQLDRYFETKTDLPGRYLRSASFSFKHYKDCEQLTVVYLDRDLVKKCEMCFTSEFYKFLIDFAITTNNGNE
jgi:hypothetical protein